MLMSWRRLYGFARVVQLTIISICFVKCAKKVCCRGLALWAMTGKCLPSAMIQKLDWVTHENGGLFWIWFLPPIRVNRKCPCFSIFVGRMHLIEWNSSTQTEMNRWWPWHLCAPSKSKSKLTASSNSNWCYRCPICHRLLARNFGLPYSNFQYKLMLCRPHGWMACPMLVCAVRERANNPLDNL